MLGTMQVRTLHVSIHGSARADVYVCCVALLAAAMWGHTQLHLARPTLLSSSCVMAVQCMAC